MIDVRMRHHWAACLIGMAVAISIRIPTAAAPAVHNNPGDTVALSLTPMTSRAKNLRPLPIEHWTGDG